MPDALEKLEKTNSGLETAPTESSKTLNDIRRRLYFIYKPLTIDAEKYKPERTIESIEKYNIGNPIGRLLYSEISSFIIGLDEKERATAQANLDTLISYVLDNPEVKPDIQKICIKLYDHFQLNLIQIENAKAASDEAITKSIVDEKEKLHEEVKSIQKEYITILGIFAAIMLAFVGGFTFSTSVLNNLGKVSTSELSVIALIIGLVFVILIAILVNFLLDINGKAVKSKRGKIKMMPASKWAIGIISVFLCLFVIAYIIVKNEDIDSLKSLFGKGVNISEISVTSQTEETSDNTPEETLNVITPTTKPESR